MSIASNYLVCTSVKETTPYILKQNFSGGGGEVTVSGDIQENSRCGTELTWFRVVPGTS